MNILRVLVDYTIFSRYSTVVGYTLWLGIWVIPAASAEPPKLSLPIDCTLRENCWLVNLVDNDLGPGRRDYLCGKNTYDTHKGTDFAIQDLHAMEKGVRVLAVAPGIVKVVRDGMADKFPDEALRRSRNIHCGNGLVIRHTHGWETQYCHLRKGSVVVKSGTTVKRGQKLGLVGHSGMAEFPHVHLSVRYLGKVVDPFAGAHLSALENAVCGTLSKSLWTKKAKHALATSMTSFFNAGFASEEPKPKDINKGIYRLRTLPRHSAALIFWVQAWWVRKGDIMKLKLIGPRGRELFNNTTEIKKLHSQHMRYAGKRRRQPLWDAGEYIGIGELIRTSEGKTLRFSVQRKILMQD